MRIRSSVVIVEKGQVVLIRRVWNGSTYFVFPGGGVEKGESLEKAAIREAMEELGVKVKVKDCIYRLEYEDNPQYFFLSEITSGTLGTGRGEEYRGGIRGSYKPVWINIQALSSMDVRPVEVALEIQSLFPSINSKKGLGLVQPYQ